MLNVHDNRVTNKHNMITLYEITSTDRRLD